MSVNFPVLSLVHSMARKHAIVTCEPGGRSMGDTFTFTHDSLMEYIKDIASLCQAQEDFNNDSAALARLASFFSKDRS